MAHLAARDFLHIVKPPNCDANDDVNAKVANSERLQFFLIELTRVVLAVVLVTTGCPRVGDHEFAATIERELVNVHRVVHQDDLVTHTSVCRFLFG